MADSKPERDWKAYNMAQTEEHRLFGVLLHHLVNAVEEPPRTTGRRPVPLRDAVFLAVQKVHGQMSCRRSSGLVRRAAEQKLVSRIPHFNTMSRALNRDDLTPVLEHLVGLSALPLAGLETRFAVDSTGLTTTQFGAYHVQKHHVKRKHRFLKAHLCVGTKSHIVAAAIITDEHGADVTQFKPLVKRLADLGFHIEEVSADKAYSSRQNLFVVKEHGGYPYIPFKVNARGRRGRGSLFWNKAFHYFQAYREEFDKHYHRRSNVESAISALKAKLGGGLRSRNRTAQVNEALCKVLAYNLTVLIHEMHETGITPSFLVTDEAPTPPAPTSP